MGTQPIRWGIIGSRGISQKFAGGVLALPDARLTAICSRSRQNADAFGDEFDVRGRHTTIEALVSDPEVDVVYIGTPHPLHASQAIACLNGGKAVLVEKPFTMNAHEAEQVISLARRRGLFAMEAMWTRFLPLQVRLRELLATGVIGDVRMVYADFGFRTDFDPHGRLFAPELGGGALLDAGIYPISLASMVLGTAERSAGFAQFGQTGVDEQFAAVLSYAEGRIATVSAATRTQSPHEATIMGTQGRIRLHAPWWRGTSMTISRPEQADETIDLPLEGNGYNYEADEVARCIRAGKLESEVMPLDESLALMQTLDAIREPWSLKYPGEA